MAARIFSMIIRPHVDAKMANGDSVSAGIGMRFAAQIVVCLFCSSIDASCDRIVVVLASVHLPSRVSGADC